jgi:hypothetical protein
MVLRSTGLLARARDTVQRTREAVARARDIIACSLDVVTESDRWRICPGCGVSLHSEESVQDPNGGLVHAGCWPTTAPAAGG